MPADLASQALAEHAAAGSGASEPTPEPEPVAQFDAWGVRVCSADADLPDRTAQFLQAIERSRSAGYDAVIQNAPARRAQVLMSEVGADTDGAPCVRRYSWRADAEHFYPASAMKTVGAIGAALALQPHASAGWTVDTPLRIGQRTVALDSGEVTVGADRSSVSLRQLLDDTLVESSNPGFNALFDIAGVHGCNRVLWDLGFDSVRTFHRLSMGGTDPAAHGFLPSVHMRLNGTWVDALPERDEDLDAVPSATGDVMIGTAYISDLDGARVSEPLDFARKNYVALHDLQGILIYLTQPELLDLTADPLTAAHRRVLADVMTGPLQDRGGVSASERESRFKPMLPGLLSVHADRGDWVYTNKAGRAYGFHLDSAFIEHRPSNTRFYLAATVFVDTDGTMNDNVYAYESLSFPFLQGVGQAMAELMTVSADATMDAPH